MYVSFSTEAKVTNEAEIDAAVEAFRRVIQGSLLVDTFDFQLNLSFGAHDTRDLDGTEGEITESD